MSMLNDRPRERGKRYRVSFTCTGESRTKQAFKDECDINKIMAKWHKTGLVEHLARNPPTFGDFTQATDFQSACNLVLDAEHQFAQLPAAIRDRMDNDPQIFVDFMNDETNLEEAQELGLIPKSKTVPTMGANRAEPPAEEVSTSSPSPAGTISGGE